MTRPSPSDRESAAQLAWVRDLALRAGTMLRREDERREDLQVHHKGRVDLVTRVDHELQAFLVTELRRKHRGDRIVAEEGDRRDVRPDDPSAVWYVDPLDGTTNFVHGHPFFAVSIACWQAGVPRVGVVYAPALDELFAARRGGGATLERPHAGTPARPLHASVCAEIEQALLATGYPYERGAAARLNLALTAHALALARGVRRAGSAAIDLCWVAAGRLDGYWELGLGPWDVAAGTLIAREAGARVTDFEGGEDILERGRICASADRLHPAMLEWIARAHTAPELDVLSPPLAVPVPRRGPLPSSDPTPGARP